LVSAAWARYRARDSKLDRDVAVKILPPEFAREAKTLASINHPHIAHVQISTWPKPFKTPRPQDLRT
jgi:serine/threonine protein kinase